MNKAELVEEVANQTGLTKRVSREAVDAIISAITDSFRQISKQEEKTRILCLLSFMMVLFLGCMPGSSAGRKAEMRPIYLIPVGKIEQDLLAHLSSLIEEIFPFSVKVDEALPDPDYAYNQRRG